MQYFLLSTQNAINLIFLKDGESENDNAKLFSFLLLWKDFFFSLKENPLRSVRDSILKNAFYVA